MISSSLNWRFLFNTRRVDFTVSKNHRFNSTRPIQKTSFTFLNTLCHWNISTTKHGYFSLDLFTLDTTKRCHEIVNKSARLGQYPVVTIIIIQSNFDNLKKIFKIFSSVTWPIAGATLIIKRTSFSTLSRIKALPKSYGFD